MKFLGVIERKGSYVCFDFEPHDKDLACYGDQVWSDGSRVEVLEGADSEVINELLDMVSNKHAFMGALRRTYVID